MSFQGFLRQATAVDVLIGPFVDSTDGDTAEESLTITASDVRLSENGGTVHAKNDATTCVHDEKGFYNCELDATDTATCGQLFLFVHESGALAVTATYHVVEEAVYDAMYGASATGPNQVVPPTVSQMNARTLVSADYFDPAADTVANVTTVGTLTGHTAQTADHTSAISTVDTVVDAIKVVTDAIPNSGAMTSIAQESTLGTPTDTDLATDIAGVSSQISNIGAASGGAVNFAPIEDNTGGAIDPSSSAFVGSVVSGTFADIGAGTGNSHSINDTGNNISVVYGYQVGGSRIATTLYVNADVDGGNDNMDVELYDHVGAQWVVMGNIDDNDQLTIPIEAKYTGTGSELGKVYLRFVNNATTPSNLEVFEGLIAAVNTSVSVGYQDGAYWVKATGTSGTEWGTNGVADSPCPWADALTMNAAQPLNRFHIDNGETVTLSATADGYTLFGEGWHLALGGQAIEGISINGATGSVTGTATATTTRPIFTNCHFGAATIPPSILEHCGFGLASGTLTAGSAGNYDFCSPRSLVPGSGSPEFTFTGLGSTTNISNRGHLGGATWNLDSDCVISHEVLAGGSTTFNTDGADIEVRGTCRSLTFAVTGTGGTTPTIQFVGVTGDVTLSGTSAAGMTCNLYGVSNGITGSITNCTTTDNTVSNDSINAQADTALSDYDPPTNTEMVAAFTEIKGATWSSSTDTLEDIRDNVGGGGGGDATEAKQDTIIAALAVVDGNVDSVLTDTGTTLPATLATIDGIVDAILVDTGTTLPSTLSTMEGKIDTIDTNVDAVLVDTGTTLPATLSTIEGKVDTVDTNVDAILVDTGTTLPALLPSNFAALGISAGGVVDSDVVAWQAFTLSGTTMIESDAGNARFTAQALEEGPSGGGGGDATEAKQDTIIAAIAVVDTNVDSVLEDTGTTLPATLTTIEGKIDTIDTEVGVIDGIVDAILVDTGTTIPDRLTTIDSSLFIIDGLVDQLIVAAVVNAANVSAILVDTGTTLPATLATIDTNVDSILVDTGTTLPSTLSTIEGKIDTVDTNIDSILVDTGTTLPASIATVDSNVDAILVDTGTTLPATLATIDGNVDSILVDTGTTIPASLTTIDTVVDGIQADLDNGTDGLGALKTLIDAVQTAVDALDDPSVADILTTQMTESYAANGTAPTLAQGIFAIHQKLMQGNYSGTTSTVYKLDNSTSAFVGTLDDATNPTEDRRA